VEVQELSVVLLADLVAGQDDNIFRIVTIDKG
jgi:hypothetical protein